MKKRILSIVLAICLILSCVPITVFAANEDATELQNLLNGGGTVTLTKDYTIDTALNVTNTVTLDLNGYTINMTGSDSVIKVGSGGNLTLQDSNKTATHTDSTLPAGGVITGGNAIFGGGVYVGSGSFTMNGGTITNCTSNYGGGVEVNGGNFTMTGSANIQGCKAAKRGGGVHIMSGGGSMTMTGGAITNCSATDGGGVFNEITFTMSGGTIANCSSTVPYASGGGGGVFNMGNFTMSDGVIENCSAASSFGGGVFHENDFTMRGGTIRGCSAKYGGGVRVDFSTFTISGGTIEACTETVNGKLDAVNMSYGASLLVNGGTIKGMVTTGSNSTIKNTSADGCTVFYDAVTNYGTISGGVYYGGIQNKSSGTVSGTYHTVSFDLNGGSGTAPILQWFFNTNTAKALQPDNPINDAYNTFAGWYNGDTKYEFTEAVTQSITLTAKYGDPKTYNISYDLDGGTASNPTTYTVESDAITLTNPTRPGFTFTGWSGTDISGQDNMTVTIAKGSTGDRTYTAHWRDLMKPVIAGIEDGKTYCDTVEFEVSDNVGVASVTANDITLTPDANNKYTLEKGTGTVTVVVIDKANNRTSVTVTVNDGHTGGTATCISKAVCDTCGEEYGELDSAKHALENIPAKAATVTETGNKEYWHCKDCKKYFSDAAGTNEIKLDDTVIAKLPPEIIEGKGQSITAGDKKELTFKSNAAFSDFIRIEIDGKILDEKNYTVKEGSTVVTLKADYVATLSVGEHTIGIVSTNGTATTTFTVNAKAVVDDDTESPQTGDNSHMALWIALLFVSGAGVIGTTVYGKKKRAQ